MGRKTRKENIKKATHRSRLQFSEDIGEAINKVRGAKKRGFSSTIQPTALGSEQRSSKEHQKTQTKQFHQPPSTLNKGKSRSLSEIMAWAIGCRGILEEDTTHYDFDTAGFFPSRASCIIRREVLQKIGLLDENLFLYCED